MSATKALDLTLTSEEVQKIDEWRSKNDFSLDRGHFMLQYDFWMQGPDIEIWWHPDDGEGQEWMTLREGMGKIHTAQYVSEIVIDGVNVPLSVTDEVCEAWLEDAKARTEAEVNAGCEPSGSSFLIKIHKSVPDYASFSANDNVPA